MWDADQTNQRERARTTSRVHQEGVCATAASAGAASVDVGDDPQRRRRKTGAECAQGLSLSLTNRIHTTLRPILQPPSLRCSLYSRISAPQRPISLSPPGNTLTPVTSQDLFQRPDHPLRRVLGIRPPLCTQSPSPATSSRKRNRDPDENEVDMSPKKKIARDDVIVALHCTLSTPIPPSPLSSR